MSLREIPEGAVEIQTGLWLHSYTFMFGTQQMLARHLYSSEGYCFYDKTYPIYDEEGNQIPEDQIQPNQRIYAQYASLASGEDINNYVSVPIQPDFEIVSRPSNNETA